MADEAGPIFRATKRRKVFRTRTDTDDEDHIPGSSTTITPGDAQPETPIIPDDSAHDDSINDAAYNLNLFKQRRTLKSRRGGLAFTQDQPQAQDRHTTDLIPAEPPSASSAAVNRFAAEVGHRVPSNDNVMTAYIDSELARARVAADPSQSATSLLPASSSNSTLPPTMPRHPAAVGKLMEIDLGAEATARNEARTHRLLNGLPEIEEEAKKPPKVRLGRDGKPRRKRWRRPSEDLKRDALVDAVMKESKLDVYDTPPTLPTPTGTDEAADDFVAERFRQDYIEAAQNRAQLRRPLPSSSSSAGAGAKGGKMKKEARGPKLGGSRSTRAQYHALEKANAAAAGRK